MLTLQSCFYALSGRRERAALLAAVQLRGQRWHEKRQILLSPLLPWGKGRCTIPTLQLALQPPPLAPVGSICPQSCFPAGVASSVHAFRIIEDVRLRAEADSGAALGGRDRDWRQEGSWEDPVAQLAAQSAGGLHQILRLPGRCFQGVGNSFPAPHMCPDRDSCGAGLWASWAPQVVFPTLSHLYEKVIFSTPHRIYCLERGVWRILWRFLTPRQPGATDARRGCVSDPPPRPSLSTHTPRTSSAEEDQRLKRVFLPQEHVPVGLAPICLFATSTKPHSALPEGQGRHRGTGARRCRKREGPGASKA